MTDSQRSRSPSLPSHHHRSHHSLYDPHYNNEHRTRRARLELPPLDPQHRYPGDGFDFRRPVMAPVGADRLEDAQTGAHPETIDLTRDIPVETHTNTPHRSQRLPRYGRDIIDISSSDDEGEAQPVRATADAASASLLPSLAEAWESDSPLFVQQDDDLEFIRSRSLSRMALQNEVISGGVDARREGSRYIDLTVDQDDDLLMVDARTVQGVNRHNPIMSAGAAVRNADDNDPPPAPGTGLGYYAGLLREAPERLRDRITTHYDRQRRHNPFLHMPDIMPAQLSRMGFYGGSIPHSISSTVNDIAASILAAPGALNMTMDYTVQGFDLDTGARQQPAPQLYEPPQPAADGFTRNPAEDEEVVCPNCGKELAVGETELQRQIYVVKQCGHVYCGVCVQARLNSSSKKGQRSKGKQRADEPQVLRTCVVDGCGRSVGKTNLVHVFLSS